MDKLFKKPSHNAQSVMKYLGCPCEYFPAGSSVAAVTNAYDDAFAKREIGGYTPVIFVIEEYMDFDESQSSADLQKQVFAAPPIDAREWFEKVLSSYKEDYGADWNDVVGEMENGQPMTALSGFLNFGTRKSWECVLAKIPVKNPWEIFAWFPFGGWNECPAPEEMLWIGKYWYEKYGAVPAVITRDVLEFSAHPIRDKSAAMGLALEQFAFCSDIVFQGVDTIGCLADSLTESSVWYFWWD